MLEIKKSFDNSKDGPSSRKLSAFQCIVMGTICTLVIAGISIANLNCRWLFYCQCAWIIGAFVFHGLVTIPQLIEALKTYKGEGTTTDTSISIKEEKHEAN